MLIIISMYTVCPNAVTNSGQRWYKLIPYLSGDCHSLRVTLLGQPSSPLPAKLSAFVRFCPAYNTRKRGGHKLRFTNRQASTSQRLHAPTWRRLRARAARRRPTLPPLRAAATMALTSPRPRSRSRGRRRPPRPSACRPPPPPPRGRPPARRRSPSAPRLGR